MGLGLTAQVSKGSEVFHVFALVALPTLFALGIFTFVRLVELGIEDFLLGRAINRIRHYYLEHAGESSRYFMSFRTARTLGIAQKRALSDVDQRSSLSHAAEVKDSWSSWKKESQHGPDLLEHGVCDIGIDGGCLGQAAGRCGGSGGRERPRCSL